MDIKYVCYWFPNPAFTKNAKQTQHMLTPEIKHIYQGKMFLSESKMTCLISHRLGESISLLMFNS